MQPFYKEGSTKWRQADCVAVRPQWGYVPLPHKARSKKFSNKIRAFDDISLIPRPIFGGGGKIGPGIYCLRIHRNSSIPSVLRPGLVRNRMGVVYQYLHGLLLRVSRSILAYQETF